MYTLNPQTLMRAEPLAALWFHRRTAETLELDLEGLQTLHRILSGQRLWSLKALQFRHYLVAKNFITKTPHKTDHSLEQNSLEDLETMISETKILKAPLRSRMAPEVLHLSLTDACQQSCSGCFFSNQTASTPNRYMSPTTYQRLLEEAVRHQVFQLALGGGEPLMHPELVNYVARATAAGLVANLTTNGALLTAAKAQQLKSAGLGQIQFSLNGSTAAMHEVTRPHFEKVLQGIEHASITGLRWGLNILVTRKNLSDLDNVLTLALKKGAAMVNLLRPKAAQADAEWLATHQLDARGHQELQELLRYWQKAPFALMTDTSYTFLRMGKARQMQQAGITGCSAGRRMLSIQVDGRCSPCSHVDMHNDGAKGFMAVWRESEHLQKFRQLEDRLTGLCGSCELKDVCRGCRAVVMAEGRDFNGEDLQCPKHRSISLLPS